MKQSVYVKPSKPSLVAGIIVSVAMFIFGIVFFILLSQDDAVIGQIFVSFWMLVVMTMGGFFIYSLVNYDKTMNASATEEIVLPDTFNTREIEVSFDDKLRKLERLKAEGLISEKEFTEKRNEIMKQKW
jgi:type IV secretory pathway VirB3-like protein